MDDLDDLHLVLLRLLKREGIDPEQVPTPAKWRELLWRISGAYTEADRERESMERTLQKSITEMRELYEQLTDERDRLQRELVIATVLQTSLLPTEIRGTHLEIAGALVPATEVGGDYYDVIHTGDTTWIAIGDVAGHGLRTALIMLMAQSIVSSTVRITPPLMPSEILAIANRALWENIRKRLESDEHMTCTLLRSDPDGRVRYAGAHEEFLVCRTATGTCEAIATPGTWLGAVAEITGKNSDHELVLADDDVIVLYTDGVTEARDTHKAQFGLARLVAVVEANHTQPVRKIRDAIFDAIEGFRTAQNDDVTVVVARYRTPPA